MKPFFPRLPRLPRPPIFLLLSLGLASTAFAGVPIEYLRPMKNSFSIGVRMVGGASVSFGGPGLGTVGGLNIHDAQTRQYLLDNNIAIPYEDGSVREDSAEATPSRLSQSGYYADANGRWQIITSITGTNGDTINGVVTGDYLAYDTTGFTTRNWNASSASQSPDGTYVDLSTYASSGVAPGQTASAKGAARPGIEMQFGRVIQRFKHFEWGFNVTLGISEFNAKTRQVLQAAAIKYTDRYQVLSYAPDENGGSSFVIAPGLLATGTDGAQIMSGPSFSDLPYTDADGNPQVYAGAYENNVVLGTINGDYAPEQITGTDAQGKPTDYQTAPGGIINGYWQVKGVYYLLRLGPMIRVPIGKKFAATASVGYIGAYIGSKMRFQEQLGIPGITFGTPKFFAYSAFAGYDSGGNPVFSTVTDIVKDNRKYLSGAYADVNFEWWLTTRTGFYAGAVYEKIGSYKQENYDRVASVKMDNGVGFHFGIITRF